MNKPRCIHSVLHSTGAGPTPRLVFWIDALCRRAALRGTMSAVLGSGRQRNYGEEPVSNQMRDKVCVITGGAGSIGSASAKLFLQEGAKVMLVDLSEATLKKTAAEIGGGDNLAWCAGDITKSDQVRNAVASTVARFGKIDVLFSNAGNFGGVAPIAEYPEDVFDAVIAVHVKGAFLAAKHTVPHMNDGGSIVITSSIVGVKGDPGVYGYITAKHAQVGLMRVLAKELAGRNIRVNTVHPGPVDNDFQLNVEKDLTGIIGRDATAFLNDVIPMSAPRRWPARCSFSLPRRRASPPEVS
jgi:NAD(P)-dependent dehydrogenase (short-subunit alcohol dehydrogenase family)